MSKITVLEQYAYIGWPPK